MQRSDRFGGWRRVCPALALAAGLGLLASGCGTAAPAEPDAGTDGGGLPSTGSTCGSSASVTGTVNGAGIASANANAAYVKSAFEYLYVGENLLPPTCCIDLTAAPAILAFGFPLVRAGTHDVATFQQVDMTSTGVFVTMDTPQGRTEAASGTVTLTKANNRWSGTFDVTFPQSQRVTGTLETSANAFGPCP